MKTLPRVSAEWDRWESCFRAARSLLFDGTAANTAEAQRRAAVPFAHRHAPVTMALDNRIRRPAGRPTARERFGDDPALRRHRRQLALRDDLDRQGNPGRAIALVATQAQHWRAVSRQASAPRRR